MRFHRCCAASQAAGTLSATFSQVLSDYLFAPSNGKLESAAAQASTLGRGEWDAASSLRLCDVIANWEQAAVVQRGTCCWAEFAQWRIKARNAATKAVKNHVADLAGSKKVSGCTDTWHKGDSEAIRLQHILSHIAVPPAGAGHDAADGSTAVQQLRHQRDQAEAQVQRLSQQLRNAEAQVAELQDAARQHAAELEQAVQLQTAALQQALQLSNTNVAQLQLQLAAAHVALAPKTAADIATQCDASLMQSADQHMQSSIDCSIDGERWDESEAGLPSCARRLSFASPQQQAAPTSPCLQVQSADGSACSGLNSAPALTAAAQLSEQAVLYAPPSELQIPQAPVAANDEWQNKHGNHMTTPPTPKAARRAWKLHPAAT